jgi:hypothetical protein
MYPEPLPLLRHVQRISVLNCNRFQYLKQVTTEDTRTLSKDSAQSLTARFACFQHRIASNSHTCLRFLVPMSNC